MKNTGTSHPEPPYIFCTPSILTISTEFRRSFAIAQDDSLFLPFHLRLCHSERQRESPNPITVL